MMLKQNFADQLKAQSEIWREQTKDYQERLEQAVGQRTRDQESHKRRRVFNRPTRRKYPSLDLQWDLGLPERVVGAVDDGMGYKEQEGRRADEQRPRLSAHHDQTQSKDRRQA